MAASNRQAMTTFQIYAALFAVTTLYAFVLSRFPKLEPDLTFAEVVLGVLMCLWAAYLDRIWNGPYTSESYEQQVWLAFKVGGTPIIVWQLYKSGRAWYRWLQNVLSRIYGNTTDRATSVAEQRRAESETDD
jgi:formate dehydrogenase maturation protein FdhE